MVVMMEKVGLSGGCKKLLGKLYRRRYFGGKQTEEKSVLRSIRQLPRNEQKQALKDWDWRKKQGIVISWLKTHEVRVSLNPKKLKEIDELIGRETGEEDG